MVPRLGQQAHPDVQLCKLRLVRRRCRLVAAALLLLLFLFEDTFAGTDRPLAFLHGILGAEVNALGRCNLPCAFD